MSRHSLIENVRTNLALILILALALGLRFFHIDIQGFTLDESSSLLYAGTPGWRSLFWDNHPFLFHLLLKIWLWFVPMTELGARSLSAIFSVIGVYAMAKVGQISGSKERGLAMALMMAFSTVSIHHGQESRMYGLFEALSTLHLWATLQLLEKDSKLTRRWYFVSLIAIVSTHLLGFLPVVFTLAMLARRHPSLRRQLAYAVVAIATILAGLCYNMRWSALQWQWRLTQIVGYQATLEDLIKNYSQNSIWIAGLMGAVFVFAYFAQARDDRKKSRLIFNIIVASWVIVRLVLTMFPRNVYVPRYFVFLNPYFIFLFVVGVEALRARLERPWPKLARPISSLVLLIFISCFASAYSYVTPSWNKLAALIISQNGKAVWTTRSKGLAMPYYYRAGIPVTQFMYDQSTIAKLQNAVEKNDVWVVEGFVGRYGYFEALNRDLIKAQMKISTYEFDNSLSEPIYALKILQDPSAKDRKLLNLFAPELVQEPIVRRRTMRSLKKEAHGK